MDHKQLIKDIEAKKFQPIYLLHGEEPYYVDLISNVLQEHALEEHERDFNQTIVYGLDANILDLLSDLKGYPMMAERKLVIIKEAQKIKEKDFELLTPYFENPVATTVFVLCYKYGNFDARKKIFKDASKNGIVFKSEKLKDYQLVTWIETYIKSLGYGVTQKASLLLADSLGNDLGRIASELGKLAIVVEKGTTINDIHIEENIGISKDYNVFELKNAVGARDRAKAFKIIHYFEQNPKAGPLVVVISNLYVLFNQIMRIQFMPNKSADAVTQALKLHPYVAKEMINTARNFTPQKAAANIAYLHQYDLKSKGLGNASESDTELMKELIYKMIV